MYQKRIAEIPVDKRTQWRFHKVAPGETVESIAHDYRVSASEIVFVNQLEAGEELSATDALVIPLPPVATSKARLTMYKMAHGDTLVTVADRFNVTVQQLRRWNHLTTTAKLEPGRRLYVTEPARVTRAASTHRVSTRKGAPATASKKQSTAK